MIDAKAAAATLGAAIAGLVWLVLGKTVLDGWSPEDMAAGLGFSASILAFVLGYLVPNLTSRLRESGAILNPNDDAPALPPGGQEVI